MNTAIDTAKALNAWNKRRFDYGDADCCQFARFVVREMTGVDHMSPFNYSSEGEAQLIIDRHGSLGETVDAVLGESVNVEALHEGSPVLLRLPHVDEVLGIWHNGKAVALTAGGFITVAAIYAQRGWNV